MTTSPSQPARPRGRPRGRTPQGEQSRQRLYDVATQLIAVRGWHQTTLRDIAQAAGVSVGLLYRYFPSKRSVLLALYDELSAEFAGRARDLHQGGWRARAMATLQTSLQVLEPHRGTLAALVPVLVGDPHEGLFASATAFSRLRVQGAFVDAVTGARDAPRGEVAPALGRVLYLVHLAVLLFWLLDRSPNQRATQALVALLNQVLRLTGPALRLPGVPGLVTTLDRLVIEGLIEADNAPVRNLR